MRPAVLSRLGLALLLGLCLASCSDSDGTTKADAGGEPDASVEKDAAWDPDGDVTDDASVDGASPEADAGEDAGVDAGPTSCLDQPGQLPLAPNGQLPCELLPPGFGR